MQSASGSSQSSDQPSTSGSSVLSTPTSSFGPQTASSIAAHPVHVGLGPIIGIALVAVLIGMVLATLVFVLLRRKRRRERRCFDDDEQSSDETKADSSVGALQVSVLESAPMTRAIATDQISPHGAAYSDAEMLHLLDKFTLLLGQFTSSLVTELDTISVTEPVSSDLDLDLATQRALRKAQTMELTEVSVMIKRDSTTSFAVRLLMSFLFCV